MVRAGRYSVCVSSEPSILRCAGVVAKIFSGAGMEAVSKRGVCLRTLLGVGLMMDGSREEVRLLVGLISTGFVLVRVTVMNLVLFWLSSTLKVYGERIVATWDCFERKEGKLTSKNSEGASSGWIVRTERVVCSRAIRASSFSKFCNLIKTSVRLKLSCKYE